MLRNKSLRQTGITPEGTINITENGTADVTNYASADVNVPSDSISAIYNQDGTQTIILNSSEQVENTAKGLADGSLTSFSAPQWGVTSLKNRRFYSFSLLQSLDLTGVTYIPEYTAYNCTGLTSLTLDPNTANIGQYAFNSCSNSNFKPILRFNNTSIGDYAFANVRVKEIYGNLTSIYSYCFSNQSNNSNYTTIDVIDIKITGSIGDYAFGNRSNAKMFTLDPTSVITGISNYAFYNFGGSRSNPSSNIFTFDFRNSTFTYVNNYVFAGSNSSSKNKYFDIYFPSMSSITYYAFQYSDYFNIYYKNIPSLSNVNAFNYATNFKNFFPYNLVQTAKTSTNWTSSTNNIVSSIYGYSDANEFSLGDTLPETDSDGYALTWYSDREMTTQVTAVADPTQMYYCSVGAKAKVKLSTTQYQATLTVSDGTNTYTNGDLVPIGATLTITAVGDTGYPDPYTFTVNGTTITSGDTYTVAQDDVSIICIYYDGVNPPVDPVFANNTPQQVKIAVDNGLHRALWNIGDTKTITLTNSNTVTLTYVDQQANRYEKVDGTGYSNAVFEITPLLGAYAMNGSNTNAGGWPASRMCTTTMSELYALLPSDWQAVISEVKIPSSAGSQSSSIVYANNKVFIASTQEMFNSYSSYAFDEGPAVFDYYDGAANSKRVKQYNGSNYSYWLRSPNRPSSSGFCCVYSDGSPNSGTAGGSRGVAACLSI